MRDQLRRVPSTSPAFPFMGQNGLPSTRKRKRAGVLCGLIIVCTLSSTSLQAGPFSITIQPEPPFFSPNSLTISAGTPLTWNNFTQEPHSIVADDCTRLSGCSFDSGVLGPNEHFTLPHLPPGRYPYHCGLHPFMRGLLTVHAPPPSSPASEI
jgi:plastocyanin